MTPLLAFELIEAAPIVVFLAIVVGAWALMSFLAKKTNRAEERLDRLGRGQSGEPDSLEEKKQRFGGIKEAIAQLGGAMEGQNELEKNSLKLKLANAGFRSDGAPMVYQGLRLLCIVLFLVPTAGLMLYLSGFTQKALIYIVILG